MHWYKVRICDVAAPVFYCLRLCRTFRPTRTSPVEAALIPVTTPSQPVCSVHTRTYTAQRLLLAGWPRPPSPVTGQPASRHQPVSITGQPATPTTDTPCVTVKNTCDFNSIVVVLMLIRTELVPSTIVKANSKRQPIVQTTVRFLSPVPLNSPRMDSSTY